MVCAGGSDESPILCKPPHEPDDSKIVDDSDPDYIVCSPNVGELPDGYVSCKLNKYLSSSIQDNHYVPEQVVFTGTQNPFKYDNEGNKIYSRAETL